MRTQGCGLACVIVVCLFLSACHSGQSALESQIKEDLQKVLNSAVHRNELSRKLTSTPPESHMLNEAHVQMYVLVRARAIQLRGSATNQQTSQLQSTSKDLEIVTGKHEEVQATIGFADGSKAVIGSDSEISQEELIALKDLELSQDLYAWVKQTIDVTVEFIDAIDDPAIFDIITLNDPVIEHNLSIVRNFQERLRLAYSDSMKVSEHFRFLILPNSDHLRRKLPDPVSA